MKQLYIIVLIFLMNIKFSCNKTENISTKVSNCMKDLTSEEKNYFLAIAFFDYKTIHKWNNDIYVNIKGNDIRNEDKKTIDKLISEVAGLIRPLKITYADDEHANLVFVLDKDIDNPANAGGQTNPKFGFFFNRHTIFRADILIFPTTDGARRKRVMYHEMMHALGLNHPKFLNQPSQLQNSIMSGYSLKTFDKEEEEEYLANHYKFSALDRKMITTLYNPCIPAGLSRLALSKAIK